MSVTALQGGDAWQRFHTETLERVLGAGWCTPGQRMRWGLPLTGNNSPATLAVVGGGEGARLADQIGVPVRVVTSEYFAAMNIGLSNKGRVFRESDNADTPPVAIVNRAFADRLPAGGRRRAAARCGTSTGTSVPPFEIVGVDGTCGPHALHEAAGPEVYLPLWQSRTTSKHLVVRTDGDPIAVAGRVRQAIDAVDPTAAVEDVKTMTEVREESVAASHVCHAPARWLLCGWRRSSRWSASAVCCYSRSAHASRRWRCARPLARNRLKSCRWCSPRAPD